MDLEIECPQIAKTRLPLRARPPAASWGDLGHKRVGYPSTICWSYGAGADLGALATNVMNGTRIMKIWNWHKYHRSGII